MDVSVLVDELAGLNLRLVFRGRLHMDPSPTICLFAITATFVGVSDQIICSLEQPPTIKPTWWPKGVIARTH